MPPMIPSSTINNKSIPVNRLNYTLVFFKALCYDNTSAEGK